MKLLRLFAVLLLLLCAFPAFAAPPALSVVPGSGTVPVSADAAYWNFPTRFLSDEKPIVHTFLLRNDTKTTLTIERIALSCDCVQAFVAETRSLPVQAAPGQTVPVQLSLSLRRLVPGPVSKSAWVYLHDGDEKGLRLELRGIVRDEPPAVSRSSGPGRIERALHNCGSWTSGSYLTGEQTHA